VHWDCYRPPRHQPSPSITEISGDQMPCCLLLSHASEPRQRQGRPLLYHAYHAALSAQPECHGSLAKLGPNRFVTHTFHHRRSKHDLRRTLHHDVCRRISALRKKRHDTAGRMRYVSSPRLLRTCKTARFHETMLNEVAAAYHDTHDENTTIATTAEMACDSRRFTQRRRRRCRQPPPIKRQQ